MTTASADKIVRMAQLYLSWSDGYQEAVKEDGEPCHEGYKEECGAHWPCIDYRKMRRARADLVAAMDEHTGLDR